MDVPRKKPKVLLTEPLPLMDKVNELLGSQSELVLAESPSEDNLLKLIVDADAMIVVYAKASGAILKAAKKLKGIVRCGIGVDNVDIKTATDLKIPVANVPDYAVETVAEHAFALLIALSKRIVKAHNLMHDKAWGNWTNPPAPLQGIDLQSKVLGFLGFGRIGRSVAKKALGCDMKIIAYDPYITPEQAKEAGTTLVELETLFAESDFISVHTALTPETKGMVQEKQFKMMKRTAYIINTSRGPVIKEEALVKALKEGWIAGAALDVYETEPPARNNPLLDLGNVVLTPHVAWFTEEAVMRLVMSVIDRSLEILNYGKPLKNVVNQL